MAEKKKCSCGCGTNAIKDGLGWGCYKKKHGVAPYGTGAKKASRKSREQGAGSREQVSSC